MIRSRKLTKRGRRIRFRKGGTAGPYLALAGVSLVRRRGDLAESPRATGKGP
jgi:hypothetical protein